MSDVGQLGQRYFGVYLGTVVDVEDPDGLGRVRIETDQYEDTEEAPTWCAVSRPLAGDVFTVFFSPKEGDQVIVAYLAGDVRQPIVLGYAHTTEKKPETAGARKHTIEIKDLGRITFDEDDRSIVIAQSGTPSATLTLKEGELTVSATKVAFTGSAGQTKFSINGQGVVLESFLQGTFRSHVHPAGTPNTQVPVAPPLPTDATEP